MPLAAHEYDRRLALYRARVRGYPDADPSYDARWRQWCRDLLAHGGELVVPPGSPDGDLDALLSTSTVFTGARRVAAGDDGDCHGNVARLWIDGAVPAIGTGYALSPDGLWRQHSWALDADGTLVETTEPRTAYVGIVLPAGPPTMQFAGSNAQAHLKSVLAARGPRAQQLIAMIRSLMNP
ncbi:hypothetical protein [Actinoplanes derwentensis]|uniref:Uncharacterized protein n=1 Tax=Actinoplanes derwentensis TaxID=113562 RepID=A0A1H1WDM0_9ACTN|nr:hypothetical protein [Actinoplanes derwentensis]GID87402.1 hypothetical protein Ade03nite_63260 [Actinoplanes derwentensis]SDS95387.1 hypothetical protein SAMN04489716_2076 [Actinoplanes derwentensis]